MLAGIYPAVWGLGQLVTGALSDRLGRKWLIAGGMLVQAAAIGWIAGVHGFAAWAGGALLLGAGTAMVFPTLLAVIGDVAHPAWRASSVGIYRLWRDGGVAVGALPPRVPPHLRRPGPARSVAAPPSAPPGRLLARPLDDTHTPCPAVPPAP